jgi:hypothetical protein
VSCFRAMLSVREAILVRPSLSSTQQQALLGESVPNNLLPDVRCSHNVVQASLLFSVLPPVIHGLAKAHSSARGAETIAQALLQLPKGPTTKLLVGPFVQKGVPFSPPPCAPHPSAQSHPRFHHPAEHGSSL